MLNYSSNNDKLTDERVKWRVISAEESVEGKEKLDIISAPVDMKADKKDFMTGFKPSPAKTNCKPLSNHPLPACSSETK